MASTFVWRWSLAAVVLGLIGDNFPAVIVRTFLATLAREQFVVPICTAMGFAHVLRRTGCDQHLVHLLVKPLEYVRFLVLPGAVLIGFLVNIPDHQPDQHGGGHRRRIHSTAAWLPALPP